VLKEVERRTLPFPFPFLFFSVSLTFSFVCNSHTVITSLSQPYKIMDTVFVLIFIHHTQYTHNRTTSSLITVVSLSTFSFSLPLLFHPIE
jgi:hypothetical protein